MHLGLKECCVPFLGPYDLDVDPSPRFLEAIWFLVHISPILFWVRIANLVCGCLYGLQSSVYHSFVHCDVDLDLWDHISYIYNFGWMAASLEVDMSHTMFWSL